MVRRKAGPKPAGTSSSANTTAPSSNTTPTKLEPFATAPLKFYSFLETLPPNHVNLTSLDITTPTVKRNAFHVSVFLNTLIVLGLCARIYYVVPTYFRLVVAVFGYDTPTKVDTDAPPTSDLLGIVSSSTLLLVIDYAIFSIIRAWPWQFLFGSREGGYISPVNWRLLISGFQEQEVVVRRSQKWDKSVFGEEPVAGKKKNKKAEAHILPLTINEILTVKLKVNPAMEERYLTKTRFRCLIETGISILLVWLMRSDLSRARS